MYRTPIFETTDIKENNSYEGEPIERKIERMMQNGDEEADGAPIIYTERKDGVLPEYNIRTDKWDLSLDGMDWAHGQDLKKRQTSIAERQAALDEKNGKTKENGGQSEGGETASGQSTVAP